ncbi:hypothetical protein TNCV_3744371 [Trichonephila clavipes]|nr:hypothetical protein TNCV_3744371 [Trichonephila clavipes]
MGRGHLLPPPKNSLSSRSLGPYTIIFRNGHLFAVFGEHFETVKNIRFSGKNLSAGHFDAYVFVSSNNEECEISESNIKVAGKQKHINPKMLPKTKRSVRFCKHKVRENMRRKRENEAPLEQESRRKSNCLQMMQGKISESTEDREGRFEYQRNVTCSIWKNKENAAYSVQV